MSPPEGSQALEIARNIFLSTTTRNKVHVVSLAVGSDHYYFVDAMSKTLTDHYRASGKEPVVKFIFPSTGIVQTFTPSIGLTKPDSLRSSRLSDILLRASEEGHMVVLGPLTSITETTVQLASEAHKLFTNTYSSLVFTTTDTNGVNKLVSASGALPYRYLGNTADYEWAIKNVLGDKVNPDSITRLLKSSGGLPVSLLETVIRDAIRAGKHDMTTIIDTILKRSQDYYSSIGVTFDLPKKTMDDVAGMDWAKSFLYMNVIYPFLESNLRDYREVARGILLAGPPGTGKTWIAESLAGHLKIPLVKLRASDLFSPFVGESERKAQQVVDSLRRLTSRGSWAMLFIDEIDAIFLHRDATMATDSGVTLRVINTLLSATGTIDVNSPFNRVIIVGTTNRPHGLDPAILRSGRLSNVMVMWYPTIETVAEVMVYHLNQRRRLVEAEGVESFTVEVPEPNELVKMLRDQGFDGAHIVPAVVADSVADAFRAIDLGVKRGATDPMEFARQYLISLGEDPALRSSFTQVLSEAIRSRTLTKELVIETLRYRIKVDPTLRHMSSKEEMGITTPLIDQYKQVISILAENPSVKTIVDPALKQHVYYE